MKINILSMGYGTGIVWLLRLKKHIVDVWLENDKHRELDAEILRSWGVNTHYGRFSQINEDEIYIVDDVGFGDVAKGNIGENIFSGNSFSDKMEMDREFMYENLKKIGIDTGEVHSFGKISEAIQYIEDEGGIWVVKLSGEKGELNKWTTKVGESEEDVIQFLRFLQAYFGDNTSLTLQEKFNGIEVAMTKFFGGYYLNFEYKNLMRGSRYKTGEMGTLVKKLEGDEDIIFESGIDRIEALMKKNGRYNVPVDVNMIYDIEKDKFYALELTCRFGYPITSIINGVYQGDILDEYIDREKFNENMTKNWIVGIVVASAPYPYMFSEKEMLKLSDMRVPMNWTAGMVNDEMKYEGDGLWRYSYTGYNFVASADSIEIRKANRKANEIIRKTSMPNIFWREDIGVLDIGNISKLRELGYI